MDKCKTKIKNAIISVFDKTGVVEFAKELHSMGVEIFSTGGTAKAISEAGIPVTGISEVTGFPEVLDGRVKTLHPKVFGGILALKDNDSHIEQMKQQNIPSFDMVVVNLYPFEKTIAKEGITFAEAQTQVDIGGPSMLRSASKNFQFVVPVIDPADYGSILEEMKEGDSTVSYGTRLKLASKVFQTVSRYDAVIADYFAQQQETPEILPDILPIALDKMMTLRYGENPHMKAAVYSDFRSKGGVKDFEQLQGKELSFNNILDMDAGRRLVADFSDPACIIMKHNNPCGVGTGEGICSAFNKALASDPVSAFGGIVSFNRIVDKTVIEAIGKLFIEIILAPGFEPDALEMLRKKKNLRVMITPEDTTSLKEMDYRRVAGGFLLQEADVKQLTDQDMKVVTEREPSQEEIEAMKFGWKVIRSVKSNAILFCGKDRTLGVGAGQMSRVDSAKIALMKAKDANLDLKGSVVISDAFFPFPDGLLVCAEAGASAVIQPGGSVRDDKVIAAANEKNIAMVFTGFRHFRH